MMQPENFKGRVSEIWPELDDLAIERIFQFWHLLLKGNETQNLTRLVSTEAFLEGHFLDVRDLLHSRFVDYPSLDLGSGCGVPGLLAACVENQSWTLAESEKRKAKFLLDTMQTLGLGKSVSIYPGRGETFLKSETVSSVVCRAVGSLEKIYFLIRKCSTWNNLVLFKGPKWEQEWNAFQLSKYRDELKVSKILNCVSLSSEKVLIKLVRVPRGT